MSEQDTPWEKTGGTNGEIVCYSRVVGGVLCRYWGDGPPSGVVRINKAANGEISAAAQAVGMRFCCATEEHWVIENAKLRNVIQACYNGQDPHDAFRRIMGSDEGLVPENAVEIAAYRKALEKIIWDGNCDPVQIAHQAITPYTGWLQSNDDLHVWHCDTCQRDVPEMLEVMGSFEHDGAKHTVCGEKVELRNKKSGVSGSEISGQPGAPALARSPSPLFTEEEGKATFIPYERLTPYPSTPEEPVSDLKAARIAASHDKAEPLYSHRGWRAMLRAALYYVDRYDQLIYQVARKYPDETRFQTALRYLRERETCTSIAASAAKATNEMIDNAVMATRRGPDCDSGK